MRLNDQMSLCICRTGRFRYGFPNAQAQVQAGIAEPETVTLHGLRHTFHDVARQHGVPDAVVKAMAGRAGSQVVRERGQGTHLHYSQGVTVDEMRQASIAVMSVVPTRPVGTMVAVGRDVGRDDEQGADGRDRENLVLVSG